MIYLDNNATTRVHPEVIEAMKTALEFDYANPSSAYNLSVSSRKAIRESRKQVAEFLGAESDEEIYFTSGGTESDNWAILGALEASGSKRGVVTTMVEHEAVRVVCDRIESKGFEVARCDVNRDGSIKFDELIELVNENTAIVSVMFANNETGVVFPVAELAKKVKEKSDALFHVDGVNAVGKIEVDLKATSIDLFSISAHKFHGPKGIGALYVRSGTEISSRNIGGGQEFGLRAGTEATHQIVGMGTAAHLACDLTPMSAISNIRDGFEEAVTNKFPDAVIQGKGAERIPNTSSISFPGLNGEVILAILDSKGVCVSTGSACNEQNHVSSPVLKAMGVPYQEAMGTIRFSFGRLNSPEEIPDVMEALDAAVRQASAHAR